MTTPLPTNESESEVHTMLVRLFTVAELLCASATENTSATTPSDSHDPSQESDDDGVGV